MTPRAAVLDLVAAGLPISAQEFAALERIGVAYFHKQAKRGVYDDFLLKPALGPKRYSGVLIARYLRGEAIDGPALGFGRRRRA